MEDTASNESRLQACEIAKMLSEHNGEKTIALDLTGQNSFADYFVIATATSFAHLRGLATRVEEWMTGNAMEQLNRHRSIADDDGWLLVDLGNIVVHLMTEEAREFYELEKLWFSGTIVFPESPTEG
jgi:ribosome-associated protein